jgi:uncharacterized protein (TIGR02171 family)
MLKRLLILPLLYLLSCSPNKPGNSVPPVQYAGMRKIAASGKSFVQGANDPQSTPDEQPGMTSNFTYDYWLDTTEVTQQEYASVTGLQPVPSASSYGVGNRYPVYDVSWYDAILFCNKKSKRDKLDTVYTYFGTPKIQSGSTYEIDGLRINTSSNGYRLPTESEWEYAAREGASTIPFPHLSDSAAAKAYAWYSSNAQGTTQAVATKLPNAFGLYDMAGNVFEWVQDWKCYYTVNSITNSFGAPLPDGNSEKVMKGGSFEHGFVSLRPSRRQTTYPTSLSQYAEYIGFRCALGAIPNPSYITSDTSKTVTNLTNLLVSSTQRIVGTVRTKVAFVNVTNNLRTLCYINYGNSIPYIYEFKDVSNVNVPSISPDGRYVAYCTEDDGADGTANVYIRSLDTLTSAPVKLPCDSAFEPRWWVDPAAPDTFLIFTTSAIDNTSPAWAQTQTRMWQISGGKTVGNWQTLANDGGFHDGRSANGQYIVAGYRNLVMRDLVNHVDHQLFVPPQNGKPANGSTQVCNVSMCADSACNGRCLFLDFGSPAMSALTGTIYGVHQYIFVADFADSMISWYQYPNGESSWGYPEWSNNAGFAIATGCNSSDVPHDIYILDLSSVTYQKIVSGTNLADPVLWIAPGSIAASGANDSLNLDSLGRYDDPALSYNIGVLTKRMQGFWKNHNTMKAVFLGSSHTSYDIDPNYFTVNKVANMSIYGGLFYVNKLLVTQYLLNHSPSLRLVGCDLIPATMNRTDYFSSWPLLDNNLGFNYDKNHGYWKTGLPNNFEKLIALAPCPALPEVDTLGSDHSAQCRGWGGSSPDLSGGGTAWATDDPQYEINFAIIKDVANQLYLKKIHFLMYITPESPYYKNTNSYGRYGPNWQTAQAIITRVRALQDTFPGYFHFYDANLDGNHDYADSDASDCEHLCPVGAQKLSRRMDSLVTFILSQ